MSDGTEQDVTSSTFPILPRGLWWALCAVLMGCALFVRWDSEAVFVDDEIRFHDPDTLRRLDRLRAVDASETYPVLETKDGHPTGSVHHWTLPMDWVIRSIDAAKPLLSPGLIPAAERPYEVGASLAGPVLGLLALLVLLVLSRVLLGPAAALLVGLVYAFGLAVVDTTRVGNADHQSLQHLALLAASLLGLIAMQRKSSRFALASGLALGFAIWVTTESMLLAYGMIGFVGFAAFFERDRDVGLDRARLAWSTGLVSMLLIGHLLEQSDFFAFEYDKVSWFQLWQALVVLVFAGAMRWLALSSWKRAGAASGIALAAGLVPFMSSALRAAFAGEFARLQRVDPWLRNEVVEFWGLFRGGSFSSLFEYESWLVLALPVLLVGVAFHHRLKVPVRAALIALTLVALGLEIWERKLATMFGIFFPLVVVVGGSVVLIRLASWIDMRAGWYSYAVIAGLLAIGTVKPLPAPLASQPLTQQYQDWSELCSALREAAPKHPPGAVIAPWGLGARIMYDADLPVVASNYHRNIDGIFDSHRFFLANRDSPDVQKILMDRDVRFIVATYDPYFLKFGALTLGQKPLASDTAAGFEVSKEGLETAFYALRDQKQLQGLVWVADGRKEKIGGREEPVWRVWAVR